MDLGAFSVNLAVKDIEASKRFYKTLGWRPAALSLGVATGLVLGRLIPPSGGAASA